MCLCVQLCVYLCTFVRLRETCGYAKPQCKGTTQQVMHCILMVVPFRIPTCSLCVSSAQPARPLGTNSTLLNSLKSPMRILGIAKIFENLLKVKSLDPDHSAPASNSSWLVDLGPFQDGRRLYFSGEGMMKAFQSLLHFPLDSSFHG